ncbi:L,D-transpeptidase [Bacillus sp. M6-12]|uniref:L,D-transpeptidase n=1 Tax=Bacillus sp. M6-12 TaxID=2054166 RepID=UPI0015E11A1C|nr:L,D-transpeptidase [Bacillus sp. M6-12]
MGLGEKNSTPEGLFTIKKRVVNPNHHLSKRIYGTRGLELSNSTYAIHGTYDKESIGKNESKGCIRLLNEDIEEFFAAVPLGAIVTIVNKPAGQPDTQPSSTVNLKKADDHTLTELLSFKSLRPNSNDHRAIETLAKEETDSGSTFYWNH